MTSRLRRKIGMPQLSKTIFTALLALLGGLFCAAARLSAQEAHAVVDVSEGCLMGGISEGRWLDADAIAPLLKGGERYRLYTMERALGEATGSVASADGEPCNGTREITLSPKPVAGIAVGGRWNALPRVPRMLSTNDPADRQVVAGVLRRRGFLRPKINITQVVRIDLDGDGIEEALISATHLAEGLGSAETSMAIHGKPGDYSFVLLRRIVKGRVRDNLLVEHFYPRKIEYPQTPYQYKVAALLDLNGDGKMEIIVHGNYYEGSWGTVFRLRGNRVENVFGCGCGA
jgi:hypothetical protein